MNNAMKYQSLIPVENTVEHMEHRVATDRPDRIPVGIPGWHIVSDELIYPDVPVVHP